MWKFNTGKSRGRRRGTSYKNTHGSLGRSQVSALSCLVHLGEHVVFCGFNLLSPARETWVLFPFLIPTAPSPVLVRPKETWAQECLVSLPAPPEVAGQSGSKSNGKSCCPGPQGPPSRTWPPVLLCTGEYITLQTCSVTQEGPWHRQISEKYGNGPLLQHSKQSITVITFIIYNLWDFQPQLWQTIQSSPSIHRHAGNSTISKANCQKTRANAEFRHNSLPDFLLLPNPVILKL